MAQKEGPASQSRTPPETESPPQPRAADDDEATKRARRKRVEEGAYYRAQRRGFAPGSELDDWYAAEAEEDERDGKAADQTQHER